MGDADCGSTMAKAANSVMGDQELNEDKDPNNRVPLKGFIGHIYRV